jgi:hypothetical protein
MAASFAYDVFLSHTEEKGSEAYRTYDGSGLLTAENSSTLLQPKVSNAGSTAKARNENQSQALLARLLARRASALPRLHLGLC